jgi:hypothetical protein
MASKKPASKPTMPTAQGTVGPMPYSRHPGDEIARVTPRIGGPSPGDIDHGRLPHIGQHPPGYKANYGKHGHKK